MNYQDNINYLHKLRDLLLQFEKPLLEAKTRDSLIPYNTNRKELLRSVANLKHYHVNGQSIMDKTPLGGIAIVAPVNAPGFALFGMSMAAALLVNGADFPLKIHVPSMLLEYGKVIKELFDSSSDFSFVEVDTGDTNVFIEQNMEDNNIKVIQIYNGMQAQQYTAKAIETGTSLLYEGRGNNPAIVHHTADLEKAAKDILNMAYALSGQASICFNRLLVDDRIDADLFNDILKKTCDSISFGADPFSDVLVGPIRCSRIFYPVEERIIDAISQGAVPYNYKATCASNGWLMQPSLFFNTNHDMNLVKEDNLAPVISVEYVNEHKLAEYASNTDYGFTASVYGKADRIKNIVTDLNSTHGIVLMNNTFNELISTDFGYVGLWGGYGKSFFHISEASKWEISQEIKPLVSYFSKADY